MDNSIYAMLSRQSGLMREMNSVANNIANSGTTGFKAERGVFSEFIARLENGNLPGQLDRGQTSLSMGRLGAHATDFSDGGFSPTGSPLDMAISGEGFFQIGTPDGVRLTRSGHFMMDAERQIVDANGNALLDQGGGTITIPPEASLIAVSPDGTITADGIEMGRIGLVTTDPITLSRASNNYWIAQGTQPVETPNIQSGFLEESNVSPVLEMARMVEVQRHYDAGQSLIDLEDERIKSVSRTIRQMS